MKEKRLDEVKVNVGVFLGFKGQSISCMKAQKRNLQRH